MKITTLMASRWVKAVFLAILGVVILLFADKFVDDLRTEMLENFDVAFEWTWDLLTILLWILVAWLFVDAALTVALSFSEHKYTLNDVMRHLGRIEKRLGIVERKETTEPKESPVPEATEEIEGPAAVEERAEDEVPPPPRE